MIQRQITVHYLHLNVSQMCLIDSCSHLILFVAKLWTENKKNSEIYFTGLEFLLVFINKYIY